MCNAKKENIIKSVGFSFVSCFFVSAYGFCSVLFSNFFFRLFRKWHVLWIPSIRISEYEASRVVSRYAFSVRQVRVRLALLVGYCTANTKQTKCLSSVCVQWIERCRPHNNKFLFSRFFRRTNMWHSQLAHFSAQCVFSTAVTVAQLYC